MAIKSKTSISLGNTPVQIGMRSSASTPPIPVPVAGRMQVSGVTRDQAGRTAWLN